MRTLATTLLLGLTLAAVALGALALARGLHIDTDLKSLSPRFAQEPAISDALNQVAADAAARVTLLLASEDEQQLYDANETLADLLDQPSFTLGFVDQSELLEGYQALLAQYPYSLLTPASADALRNMSDEQLLEQAQRNLYGQAGSVRLVPVPQDPLGHLNLYASTALAQVMQASGEEVTAGEIGGSPLYYSTHQLQLPGSALQMDQQARVLGEIDRLEKALKAEYPELTVLRSGMVFFAAEAARSAKADISLITTGSGIGVLILLLLVFRSLKALLLPAVSIAGGSAFAFVLCHAVFGSVHILTIVFGASLIGVLIDYSLHFFYLFDPQRPQAERQLYRALFLSLLTSVIGYGALSLSGLQALQQIALFSAFGLIFGFLVVVSLGRFFASAGPVHDCYLRMALLSVLNSVRGLPSRYLACAIAVVAVALIAAGGLQMPVNDSPKAFFTANDELLQQEQQISELSTSFEPATFVVIDGASVQDVFDAIVRLEELAGQASTTFTGIDDLLPSPQQQATYYDLNTRLYGKNGLIDDFIAANNLSQLNADQYISAYEQSSDKRLLPDTLMQQLQGDLPPLWVSDAGTAYAFLLIAKGADLEAVERAASQLANTTLVSAVAETSSALAKLRQASLKLLAAALAAAAILMMIRFGWRRGGQLMMVPTATLLLTLLALSALQIPLTLFHSMALFLVLGLGMDYMIFAAEIPEQFDRVLAAITLSAVTSLLSFGLLSLSSLPAVSAFGVTVLLGNSLNLFGCLLLSSRSVNQLSPTEL